MAYAIVQNQTGLIDPSTSILDTGWSTDGVYATHVPCNPGTMISAQNLGLQVGRLYVFQYTMDAYVSGGVRIGAGTTNGTYRNVPGTYTESLLVANNTNISFYSDGALRISQLSFYDLLTGVKPGRTIVFNEKENAWVQEWEWQSEIMVKFIDKLFTFKDGQLYLHNSNPVLNNFFGVQYSAQVTFISNQEYAKNKLWFNMRLDSTGKWYAPKIITVPDDQFPNGMETTLSKNNIKSIDGKLWADILRDFTDPNFTYITDPGLRQANALFRGRMMQGGWLIVTLQNDEDTLATLSAAEIFYIDVEKTLKP